CRFGAVGRATPDARRSRVWEGLCLRPVSLVEGLTALEPPHKTNGETRGATRMRWLGMVCTRLCTRRGAGTSLRGPTRSNEIRENSPVSVGMDEDLGA